MNNIKKKLCVTICNSWLVFDQSQPQLSYMRYISVGCVIGIIAGFCIGPGKKQNKKTILYLYLAWKLSNTFKPTCDCIS